MKVTATIHWKDSDGAVAELDFAYALNVGSTFTMKKDGETLICTVEVIMHYPTFSDSKINPTVGYFVSKDCLSDKGRQWKQTKKALGAGIETFLKPN